MKKILIVEDKPEERESLKLLIERMCVGVKVYTAAEEEKAYSIAMKYSINLFLVDVNSFNVLFAQPRGTSIC